MTEFHDRIPGDDYITQIYLDTVVDDELRLTVDGTDTLAAIDLDDNGVRNLRLALARYEARRKAAR